MSRIKAILIDPEKQEIREIEVGSHFEGEDGMYAVISCDTIEHLGLRSDHAMLFDERGTFNPDLQKFSIRMQMQSGTAKQPSLSYQQDILGKALIVGFTRAGKYTRSTIPLQQVEELVTWKTPLIATKIKK